MKKDDLPEAWRVPLSRKGISSRRGLARAADVSPNAVIRLMNGEGTSVETVRAVANALFDGDANAVWELHGSEMRDYGDWNPPSEVALLADDQREVLESVIRAMLPAEIRRSMAIRSGIDKRRRERKQLHEVLGSDPMVGVERTTADVLHAQREAARTQPGRTQGQQARDAIEAVGEEPHGEGPEGGA